MARAWPFEGQTESGERAKPRVRKPQDFVAQRREGTEAVVVRIGLNDAQLVLVDAEGAWERWVYHSLEEAEEAGRSLGIDLHTGEYPEAVRVRMNAYQRPVEDFDRAAYPEQGQVGPVMPYPENRPRSVVIEHPHEEETD